MHHQELLTPPDGTTAPYATAPGPLSVSAEAAGSGTLVLRVTGEIDLTTVALLHQELALHLADPHAEAVVLDLAGVSFLAARGLSLLIEACEWARAGGTALRMVTGNSHAVTRPLQATGLDRALPLADTSRQAAPAA